MVSHGSTYRLHLVVHIILKPKRNVLFCLLLKDTRYQRIAEKLKTWCLIRLSMSCAYGKEGRR
jgi:hypothetical protein